MLAKLLYKKRNEFMSAAGWTNDNIQNEINDKRLENACSHGSVDRVAIRSKSILCWIDGWPNLPNTMNCRQTS